MDLERMRALLAALQEARYAGIRSVSYDGKSINYGSDAELANAISDLKPGSPQPPPARRVVGAGAPWPRRVCDPWRSRLSASG